MNELVAFTLGLFAKALMGVVVGKGVSYALNNLKDLPRITHYLEGHLGRSHVCQICNEPTKVDSIASS